MAPADPDRPRATWCPLPGSEPVEGFLTIIPGTPGDLAGAFQTLSARLTESPGRQVLELRAFASRSRFPAILSGLRNLPGWKEWPLSLLDGSPSPRGGLAGFQVHLLQGGTPVETLTLDGRAVGRVFQRNGSRYCVLGGLGPGSTGLEPGEQARETLLRMERLLGAGGMGLNNLVRTWFFMDGILAWYDEFNQIRTGIFNDRGICQGYVPASTGIGGANHLGSALLASALAAEPGPLEGQVEAVPSSLQCPAGSYGSNFSRAAELKGEGFRRILVSGTASIDPQGVTAHRGDPAAQIDLTFRVVHAILQEQGTGFRNVIRGNAYFRNLEDVHLLPPALARYAVDPALLVTSRNTVCRGDLLFEMEVEAVATS